MVDENSQDFSNIPRDNLIQSGPENDFPSRASETGTPEPASDEDEVPNHSYERIRSEIQQWEEAKKERRLTLLNRPPVVELDPWIRYTKWYEVLERSKHNLIRTYEFLRVPDPDELELQRVIRAWKRVKERCLDTLAATDHKDVLKWWASPKNDVASQRPFELPQNAQSLDKYSRVWEQFICYLVRTVPDRWGEEVESETGIKFTREQWESLQRIKDILIVTEDSNTNESHRRSGGNLYGQRPRIIGDIPGQQHDWSESESEDSSNSSDPEDSENDEFSISNSHEEEDQNRDPELTNEVMNLCRLVLMQDTSRIPLYDSPLIHYLAVRGVDVQSEGFRGSFFYTPILAGALWISRMIMMEVAVPATGWPELGLESKAIIPSIPERIRTIREHHLVEGSFSPVSSILTQLAMGKKYNKTHESPSNIHWSPDSRTIYFGGMPVELAKIEVMGNKLVQECRELLQELALGLELPTIDLDKIIDSMAWSSQFRRTDYSFINHSRNPENWRIGHEFLFP